MLKRVFAAIFVFAMTSVNVASAAEDALQTTLLSVSKAFMSGCQQHNSAAAAATLTPDFIYAGPHGAVSKAAVLGAIAHCELTSYAFSDEQMRQTSTDSAILIYKLTQDLTCAGHKQPQNTINTDTLVRRDGHGLISVTTETELDISAG
jgi:hypothetical protein